MSVRALKANQGLIITRVIVRSSSRSTWNVQVCELDPSEGKDRCEESSRGVLFRSRIGENGTDGLCAAQGVVPEIYDCEFALSKRAGLRGSAGACIGWFDPKLYFADRVERVGNTVLDRLEAGGNNETAPWPSEPGIWAKGFVGTD
jgi:hypothetical protein